MTDWTIGASSNYPDLQTAIDDDATVLDGDRLQLQDQVHEGDGNAGIQGLQDLTIMPVSGAETDGLLWTEDARLISDTNGHIFNEYTGDLILQDFSIQVDVSVDASNEIYRHGVDNIFTAKRMMFRPTSNTGTESSMGETGSDCSQLFENCLVYDFQRILSGGGSFVQWFDGDITVIANHCTVIGQAVMRGNGQSHAVNFAGCLFGSAEDPGVSGMNNAVYNAVDCIFSGAGDAGNLDTNTNNLFSKAFTTSEAAEAVIFNAVDGTDFSLNPHANNLAIDHATAGVVEDDIAREARIEASDDAGAFEFQVAVGGLSIPVAVASYRRRHEMRI